MIPNFIEELAVSCMSNVQMKFRKSFTSIMKKVCRESSKERHWGRAPCAGSKLFLDAGNAAGSNLSSSMVGQPRDEITKKPWRAAIRRPRDLEQGTEQSSQRRRSGQHGVLFYFTLTGAERFSSLRMIRSGSVFLAGSNRALRASEKFRGKNANPFALLAGKLRQHLLKISPHTLKRKKSGIARRPLRRHVIAGRDVSLSDTLSPSWLAIGDVTK